MIDEFLIRPSKDGKSPLSIIEENKSLNKVNGLRSVLLHGHCYQKTQKPVSDGFPIGINATRFMLSNVGYSVELIDSSCCGMAGAFGYELEHFQFSMRVGEMKLFPAVREATEDRIISACGVSCKSQIEDGTNRRVIHPVQLVYELLI
jgi:Fe-S oxidoreductase